MSRRFFGMRWALGGALLMGLVLVASGGAADGQALIIGQLNTATNATTLACSRPGLMPSSCFISTSDNGTGLDGRSTGGGGTGVFGSSTAGTGVWGRTTLAGPPAGVRGESMAVSGVSMGVQGLTNSATALAAGVKGETLGGGAQTAGVYGSSPTGMGVLGVGGNVGVVGIHPTGGLAGFFSGSVYGIHPTGGLAAYFGGNVHVQGTLSKSAGSFRIDHPLDKTKYLQHSFVESPDMMNVYNGNVRTDRRGFATVRLPRYFGALNRDFRYQLTIVGTRGWRARVVEKIRGNSFRIQTDAPRAQVSWQVTGIRKDRYANAHRIQPEIAKSAVEPAALRAGQLNRLRAGVKR